jgi:hypothetical protein
MAFPDFLNDFRDLSFLVVDQALDACDSLVVVLGLGCQDVDALTLPLQLLVQLELDVPEMQQLLVVLVVNFLLFADHVLVILDFLPQVQIRLVAVVRLRTEAADLLFHALVLDLHLSNRVKQPDLFLLDVAVFQLGLVELSNESVDLLSVLRNSVQVLVLHVLNLNLDLLVLVQQIPVLVLQMVDVPMPGLHLLDFSTQFVYEELLVLADSAV